MSAHVQIGPDLLLGEACAPVGHGVVETKVHKLRAVDARSGQAGHLQQRVKDISKRQKMIQLHLFHRPSAMD